MSKYLHFLFVVVVVVVVVVPLHRSTDDDLAFDIVCFVFEDSIFESNGSFVVGRLFDGWNQSFDVVGKPILDWEENGSTSIADDKADWVLKSLEEILTWNWS